jgi:hypothetical protein
MAARQQSRQSSAASRVVLPHCAVLLRSRRTIVIYAPRASHQPSYGCEGCGAAAVAAVTCAGCCFPRNLRRHNGPVAQPVAQPSWDRTRARFKRFRESRNIILHPIHGMGRGERKHTCTARLEGPPSYTGPLHATNGNRHILYGCVYR